MRVLLLLYSAVLLFPAPLPAQDGTPPTHMQPPTTPQLRIEAGSSLGEGSKVDVSGLLNSLRDKNTNVIVFAACDGNSQSFESDALQQGIFTLAIARGFSIPSDPATGEITLFGLQQAVDREVRKESKEQQKPVITMPDMTGNLTLGIKPG